MQKNVSSGRAGGEDKRKKRTIWAICSVKTSPPPSGAGDDCFCHLYDRAVRVDTPPRGSVGRKLRWSEHLANESSIQPESITVA
jgi:hypothetical protein